MSRFDEGLSKARGMMAGFTVGQRAVVIVGILLLVMGAYGLSRWVAQPTMTPLFSGLSGTDASAVVDELTTQGVSYSLADGGGTVMVPQSQVYALRVALAGKGIPANSGGDDAGWSLLDQQGITATDFQQNVAYQRALEGELQKTLEAIDGVNTAVVNIAVPKKDVFSEEQDKTTASVLLSLGAGRTLTDDQVQAITNLVAGSVSGLNTDQVTVTDQAGTMLAGPGAVMGAGSASRTDKVTAQYEDRLSKAAQAVLDTVVGKGNAVVRVNAQLDFSNRDTVNERYTQPTPTAAPISEATVNEQYSGNGTFAGGTLGQVAPTIVSGNGNNGAYSRTQGTVNRAIDKTVERVQNSPGEVQRLTVAVVLNARKAGSLNTGQVQQIIANSVGLNPTRGDAVQVQAMPFDQTATAAAAKALADETAAAKTAQYIDLGKKVGLGLLALIVLFVVMKRRKKAAALEATAADLPATGTILEPAALTAGPSAAAIAAEDDVREKIRDDVAALVENSPEDVAQMLQSWLSERKT